MEGVSTASAPAPGDAPAVSAADSTAKSDNVSVDTTAYDAVDMNVDDTTTDEATKKDDKKDETKDKKKDDIEARLQRMTEANKRLVEIFDAHPEIPQLLTLLDKGASFAEALAHVVDVSELSPADGDPDYDAWDKASKERMKKRTEREKFLSDLDSNLQMSQQEIDAFTKENNLGEEEAKTLLQTLDDMMTEVYNGKISKQLLSMLRKASTFDSEVETAKKQGEIKARNEKIEAIKSETKKGDGLPNIGNAGADAPTPAPEQGKDSFSAAIDNFNRKQVFN
jgi:hypothetical protein